MPRSGNSKKVKGNKMITKKDYLSANAEGLKGTIRFYRSPALTVAADLGFARIDLSTCDDVVAFRFGRIPDCGISHNYRDNVAESGLSVAWIKGRKKEAKARNLAEFGGRKKVRVEGLLLPVTGSDGEPLILPYGIEESL